MAIQTVTINVEAQPTADRIQTFLVLSQNENGRQIRFRILGDELPVGCTATLSGEKPDGNVWSKAGTVSDNFVTVNEDIQMTAVAGRWDAQLDIVHGSENIVTAPIRIAIEPAAVDAGAVPSDTQLEGYVEQCKQYAESAKNEAYGSPLTAATAAGMTDQGRVYVYTGSETGYTSGHWYYHNGSAWVDGGVYNAVAVDTDTTLSIAGKPADSKKTGDEISQIKEDFTDMVNSAYVTDSASGSVAHFVDGADNVPLKSLKVNIKPVQSGSGDPSPENVRPISGFNSVKVTRTGKNLLKNSASSTTISGVTFTVNDDGSVTVNGTNNSSTTISFHLGGGTFFALPEGSYVLSGCPSGGGATSYFLSLYHHGAGANNFGKFDFGSGKTYDLTTESNTGLGVRIGVISGQTVDNLTFYPMLRLASDTDDTYEPPYNGDTYTISLSSAGTVYGGTLDVLSGELTVDRKMVVIDGSTVPFTFASSNNTNAEYKNAIFGIASVDALQSATASAVPDMMADKATAISYNAAASKTTENYGVTITDVGITTQTRVRVAIPKSQNVVTVAEANAWAANNPITVIYPLTNPLTYQLTATEIKSLLGINNVWSDAGDIDVEYRADTKLFIERLTAPDSADMIADANITSGKYFMVGNNLYKATANIANGAQIIVGTNCISKSLSEALNEINA